MSVRKSGHYVLYNCIVNKKLCHKAELMLTHCEVVCTTI